MERYIVKSGGRAFVFYTLVSAAKVVYKLKKAGKPAYLVNFLCQ